MSSSLLFAILAGVACDPTASQTDAGAVIAPPSPEEAVESAQPTPEEAVEAARPRPVPLAPSALKASPSSSREDAHELDGSTLQGNVAIHLALKGGANVEKVEFFLDDPARQGPPMTTLTSAPFDLAGTVSPTEAALFDTRSLAAGEHTVTVAVSYRGRAADVVTAKFTVENDEATTRPAPAPGTTPEPSTDEAPGTDETAGTTPAPTPSTDETPGTTPAPAPSAEQPVNATASAISVTGLRSVAAWEQLFVGRWNTEHTNDYLPRSKSADSWKFYNLGYGIDATTAMYRATGKTQYLDRALLYVNNMVATAKASSTMKSNYKDSYLGWTSKRAETLNREEALYESYCWRYVTTLLRVIRETPALYGNSTYRAQYDKLLAFTEKNIFEKWYTRSANANIYRVNTHMASHWAKIAMDLSRLTTDSTRKARYLTVLNNINQDLPNYSSSLRQQMRASTVNPAAYFWSATWGSTARPGQDVSHGNGVMAYVVEAHDLGVEWTATDINKFVATFNSIIWKGAGKYGNYVDGSGTGNGWFTDGFIKLGRYDSALQRRLESHTVGRGIQFYGNGALNMKLLTQKAAAQ